MNTTKDYSVILVPGGNDSSELYEPLKDCETSVSPECGNELPYFKGDFISLVIQNKEGIISLIGAYDEKSDLVKNQTIVDPLVIEEFGINSFTFNRIYMYETINFNTNAGKAHTVFCLRDTVMNNETDGSNLTTTSLTQLIDESAEVKSRLKSCFDQCWKENYKADIPFKEDELNSTILVLLTQFGGYDKSFYENIILLTKNEKLYKELMTDVGKKLHSKIDNKKLYSALGLPHNRLIRDFILESPEYFFHYTKIRKLHKKVGSKALFRFLSGNEDSFKLLSECENLEKLLTIKLQPSKKHKAYTDRSPKTVRLLRHR